MKIEDLIAAIDGQITIIKREGYYSLWFSPRVGTDNSYTLTGNTLEEVLEKCTRVSGKEIRDHQEEFDTPKVID